MIRRGLAYQRAMSILQRAVLQVETRQTHRKLLFETHSAVAHAAVGPVSCIRRILPFALVVSLVCALWSRTQRTLYSGYCIRSGPRLVPWLSTQSRLLSMSWFITKCSTRLLGAYSLSCSFRVHPDKHVLLSESFEWVLSRATRHATHCSTCFAQTGDTVIASTYSPKEFV